ncbi:uncharacterized protein LY79DRAFT_670692 [Colletotrichum navitas]|uniref:Uncharacterized protein n=1 Tax=Colletotrichum navitas TaxID=681940 RepID=A0AAD8PXG3_9PEZI|nr:uncharacterized protein LY79DRAFT_670692 [Colletotrichum navitas]KAK1585854.1 hypothetical protein LY79DRAFT_670692 [Colletotrichum navitas]
MSGQLERQGLVDHAIEIKEESPAPDAAPIGDIFTSDIMPSEKPREKIFFLKRFFDGHPRLDVLIEIGTGCLRPGTNKAEFAIWETCEDIYIYRKASPEIKLLQSIGNVEYVDPTSPMSHVKRAFAKKTCGFVGARDSNGQLRVLKLAVSGTSFKPRRDEDNNDFIFHAKWATRVKHLAKRMKINLRTIYDGHHQKANLENTGNWRAGHVEKKLATHIVWTFLAKHRLVDKTRKVSLEDLRQLRQCLQQKGSKPQFELHLSRAPCGTFYKPGRCVPFVRKLAQLTGVHFTIHSWEENMILDGSVPSRCAPREVEKIGPQDRAESPGAYDSEDDDLEAFLDEAEAQTNIVFDGFEEPPPKISGRAAQQRFAESIRRFDNIKKPMPPTPVFEDPFWQAATTYGRTSASSRSHFWEDTTPLSSRRRQSAASEDKRDRRARKLEVRRRRSAVSASEATQHSAEMSALAGRLGGLLNSSRLLR